MKKEVKGIIEEAKKLFGRPVSIASIIVVTAGIALGGTLSSWFFIAGAAGFALPLFLRNFGILRDIDEFHLHAQQQAGTASFISLLLLTI